MFDIFDMLKKDKDEKKAAVKQVTRETIIGDILDMDQTTAPYFMEIGMHCLGCPASRGETIEEACEVHGVDCDELIAVHAVHLAGLLDGLAAGSRAAQAVHPDLHEVGCGGLVHIQDIADDGLAGDLLHGSLLFVLVLLEHIKNIKHDGVSFLFRSFRQPDGRPYILYPITRFIFKYSCKF